MSDQAPTTSPRRSFSRVPLLQMRWQPSRRDKFEGIIAYSLLGVVACSVVYIFCLIAVEHFA